MDQPSDDKDRNNAALRVAGVGLGILGATFGVAGWFTLAPSAAATESVVVSTRTGTTTSAAEAAAIDVTRGRAHTHTGGA